MITVSDQHAGKKHTQTYCNIGGIPAHCRSYPCMGSDNRRLRLVWVVADGIRQTDVVELESTAVEKRRRGGGDVAARVNITWG